MEEWKDITGYEDYYQVSDLGKVKSLPRTTTKGKILKASVDSSGYYVVNLSKNKNCKTFKVHKLVAIAFLNHTPDGMNVVVDHFDNDKSNNCVDNLRLVSQRKNSSKDRKGSSKYTGVVWSKGANKWKSRICLVGSSVQLHLGYFKNEQEASKIYQKSLNYILENNIKEGEITAKELRKILK